MNADPRLPAAIALGRLAAGSSRALHRGAGAALPGLVALSVYPDLVRSLSARLGHGSILVTGTNGKTTTARMIRSMLRRFGLEPLSNETGSNLLRGIAASFLNTVAVTGAVPEQSRRIGVFEVDEAVLPMALDHTGAHTVIFTNLFRDQLDRYGEVDAVAARWRRALEATRRPLTLVLNADDPVVANLGEGLSHRRVFFGIDDVSWGQERLDFNADARWCPRCNTAFQYQVSFYGHLGHYVCPRCELRRPEPQIAATAVQADGLQGLSLSCTLVGTPVTVRLTVPGLYNAYNALAAASTGVALGVPLEDIRAGLEAYTVAFGRVERVAIDGRAVTVFLVKNPVGLNQVLRTLALEPGPKRLLLVLNDDIADGRDISWIWDVDFEALLGAVEAVTVSGTRAEELALRIKYASAEPADPDRICVVPALDAALSQAVAAAPVGASLYVLPTYTAMLALRRLLAARGHLPEYWERVEVP